MPACTLEFRREFLDHGLHAVCAQDFEFDGVDIVDEEQQSHRGCSHLCKLAHIAFSDRVGFRDL